MFKNKKNVVIIILSIIILLLLVSVFILFLSNNHTVSTNNIDGSNMTSDELINMFKTEGYTFDITDMDGTIYIILENKIAGITIQRIYNKYLGNLMTFDDNSINDKMADLTKLDKNNTPEEELQYKAYESWMKKYNITKTQLSNMLDDYYSQNKSNTKTMNIQNILNNTTN